MHARFFLGALLGGTACAVPAGLAAKEPTKPAEVSRGFTVQVASTSSRPEAERLVALLSGRDLGAYWTEAVVGGKTVYRVRVGSFPTRETAKELAEGLASELKLDYWIAPEEPVPPRSAAAPASPAPFATRDEEPASGAGTEAPLPAATAEPPPAGAETLLAEAMSVHGGPAGGFAAVDRAASVFLSYRLKSLDAKTGAPVFTRHVYRRKGKDRLRLEITAIDDSPALARDASGQPIRAASSITVHAPGGAWVDAGGRRAPITAATARARVEALGPSGMLRLPLAFPSKGPGAVGITRMTVAGTRTLNGRPAIRMDATPPPKPYREASLYFDPASRRLVAARFLTDAGELLLTFADYRTVAPSLVVPFERVVYRDGTIVSSVEIDGLELDVEMADSLFAR